MVTSECCVENFEKNFEALLFFLAFAVIGCSTNGVNETSIQFAPSRKGFANPELIRFPASEASAFVDVLSEKYG